MRIGLIGVGRIDAFHAATLRGLPGVDSVIVADADRSRARNVAMRLAIEAANAKTAKTDADAAPDPLDAGSTPWSSPPQPGPIPSSSAVAWRPACQSYARNRSPRTSKER